MVEKEKRRTLSLCFLKWFKSCCRTWEGTQGISGPVPTTTTLFTDSAEEFLKVLYTTLTSVISANFFIYSRLTNVTFIISNATHHPAVRKKVKFPKSISSHLVLIKRSILDELYIPTIPPINIYVKLILLKYDYHSWGIYATKNTDSHC